MTTPQRNWSAELKALHAKAREVERATTRVLDAFDREELQTAEVIRQLLDRYAEMRQVLGRRQTSILRRHGGWGQRGYKRVTAEDAGGRGSR